LPLGYISEKRYFKPLFLILYSKNKIVLT